MQTRDRDEEKSKVHGAQFWTTGRNGYSWIDYRAPHDGRSSLLGGLKTRKGAEEICRAVQTVQHESYKETVTALIAGGSANSNQLFDWTMNDGDLYRSLRSRLDDDMRKFFDANHPDHLMNKESLEELHHLYNRAYNLFAHGLEKWEKSFEDDEQKLIFSPLDRAICCYEYLERCAREYRINRMR